MSPTRTPDIVIYELSHETWAVEARTPRGITWIHTHLDIQGADHLRLTTGLAAETIIQAIRYGLLVCGGRW